MALSMYRYRSGLLGRTFSVVKQCVAGKKVLSFDETEFEKVPKPHPELKLASQNPIETPKGKIADKLPIRLELEEGKKYSWCACGYSHNQPFCDGTHRQKQIEKRQPGLQPLRFEVKKTKMYWLCRCKRTKNAPWCDGSHKSEEVASLKGIQVTT